MPRWSPDGKWIAYLRGGGEKPGAIWIIRADGGGRQRVTPTGREAQLAWTR
jgi:Tol biopolymer transport system component